MSNTDITNPGSVNVADEGDGRISVDQPVTVSPSYNAGAANFSLAGGPGGRPVDATNPGDSNVVDQAFGRGLPKNVNVS